MADVAALVGGAQGSDALASLETTLRPIEKYAVRIVEEVRLFAGVHATLSRCGCFKLRLTNKYNVRFKKGVETSKLVEGVGTFKGVACSLSLAVRPVEEV